MTRIVSAEPPAKHQAQLPVGWSIIKGIEWLIVQLVLLVPRIIVYAVKRSRESKSAFILYVYAAVPACFLFYDAYLGWGPYIGGAIRSMLTITPNLRSFPLPFAFGTVFHTMSMPSPFAHEVLTLVQLARLGALLLPVPLADWGLRAYTKRYERLHPPPPPIYSDPEQLVIGLECKRTWVPEENKYKIEPTREFCTIGWPNLPTGVLVLAPPGGGKTTFLKQIMKYNDRNDIAYLAVDYKGDQFDPKEFDFNFDLANPKGGPPLNITSGFSPRTVGMNLGAAGVPFLSMNQEYFTGVARQTTEALFVCHYGAYDEYPEIRAVISYTRNAEARGRLLKALKDRNYPLGSEQRLEMDRIIELGTKKGQDAFGTLDVALSPLAWGAPRKLLTTRGGIGFDELLSKPTRIRLGLAFNEYNHIAPVIGRLVMALFINSVLSPRNPTHLRRMIILDEAAPFMSRTLLAGMQLMRYHNGSVVLGLQDTHLIEDRNLREQTITLSGNKIVMGGIGGDDADTMSELFGGIEHEYHNDSAGLSQGNSVNVSGGLGSGRRGKAGSVIETSGKTQLARVRSNYLPSELRYQEKHHAVVETHTATGEIIQPVVVDMNDAVVMPSVELQGQISVLHKAVPPPALPGVGPFDPEDSGVEVSKIEEVPDSPKDAPKAAVSQAATGGSTPALYTLSDKRSAFAEDGTVDDQTEHNIFMPPERRADEPDWGMQEYTGEDENEPGGGSLTPPEGVTQTPETASAPKADDREPGDQKRGARKARSQRNGHRQLRLSLPSDEAAPGTLSKTASGGEQPEWAAEVVPLLVSKLPTMDEPEALSWCIWAYRSGRNGDYLKRVLDYVLDDPELHNPVGKFVTLVRTNQESPCIPGKAEEKPAG